jgi:hypothetical protein
VKTLQLTVVLSIFLLFACVPKKPEIPMIEVPAGPLLHKLEQRQKLFHGMKAMASVETRKWGNKRMFENVGIVLDGLCRLRMEAYGPLGQTIMALVWDGREAFFYQADKGTVERQGQAGIEHFLGEGLNAREFCAVLSGNIPKLEQSDHAVLLCGENGNCLLEIRGSDSIRRVQLEYPSSGTVDGVRPVAEELFRDGNLIYRVRFDRAELTSHYRLPTKIEIENPSHNLQLTIEYAEAEVNVPISNDAFTFSLEQTGGN